MEPTLLDQLAAAAAELDGIKERERAAEEKRDDLIRRALAAKFQPQEVYKAGKVSKSRMYQIRDGKR